MNHRDKEMNNKPGNLLVSSETVTDPRGSVYWARAVYTLEYSGCTGCEGGKKFLGSCIKHYIRGFLADFNTHAAGIEKLIFFISVTLTLVCLLVPEGAGLRICVGFSHTIVSRNDSMMQGGKHPLNRRSEGLLRKEIRHQTRLVQADRKSMVTWIITLYNHEEQKSISKQTCQSLRWISYNRKSHRVLLLSAKNRNLRPAW